MLTTTTSTGGIKVARRKTTTKKSNLTINSNPAGESENFLQRIQDSLTKDSSTLFPNKQSYLSLILGVFIVVVLAVLLYNYFSKPTGDIGPSGQAGEEFGLTEDVSKENLPGKYTVKEDDTLFLIAQKYFDDGYLYSEIVEANNLQNENLIEVGQVLEIPKLENAIVSSSEPPTDELIPGEDKEQATGGATNQSAWGEIIEDDTYTVKDGDWLSKIAGRAYGDIMAYGKIAEANNISNPDLIEPGMVLKIPK